MKYFAYTLDLKDDEKLIAEYLQHHKNLRRDVCEAVWDSGVIDEKIWISGNHLFMIVIGDDDWEPSRLFEYAQTKAGQEWNDLMFKYQVPVKEAKEGEWWSLMDLVVDMDEYKKNQYLKEGGSEK